MSIRGGNIEEFAKGLSSEEKSGGFLVVSSLLGVGRVGRRFGNVVDLKRESRDGVKLFLTTLK